MVNVNFIFLTDATSSVCISHSSRHIGEKHDTLLAGTLSGVLYVYLIVQWCKHHSQLFGT